MDTRNLEFNDNNFYNITLFYTLMFIKKEYHGKVIKEAYRVLKDGGSLHIWDSNIDKANPFLVNLNINANGTIIDTTYGIYKEDAFQDKDYFKCICEEVGLNLINESLENKQFYIYFNK